MKQLLFSAAGRIARGQYWKGILISSVLNFTVVGVLAFLIGSLAPHGAAENGQSEISLLAVIPISLLTLASLVVATWASICLGIKRLHDHGKPGIMILLGAVPLANLYLIVLTAFLKGEAGPNAYGPDPLAASAGSAGAPLAYAPAR